MTQPPQPQTARERAIARAWAKAYREGTLQAANLSLTLGFVMGAGFAFVVSLCFILGRN